MFIPNSPSPPRGMACNFCSAISFKVSQAGKMPRARRHPRKQKCSPRRGEHLSLFYQGDVQWENQLRRNRNRQNFVIGFYFPCGFKSSEKGAEFWRSKDHENKRFVPPTDFHSLTPSQETGGFRSPIFRLKQRKRNPCRAPLARPPRLPAHPPAGARPYPAPGSAAGPPNVVALWDPVHPEWRMPSFLPQPNRRPGRLTTESRPAETR